MLVTIGTNTEKSSAMKLIRISHDNVEIIQMDTTGTADFGIGENNSIQYYTFM